MTSEVVEGGSSFVVFGAGFKVTQGHACMNLVMHWTDASESYNE
jgi:hypothetical protein